MRYHQLKRIIILLMLCLFIPMVVQADTDTGTRVDPKEEEQGGIVLDSQRFPYSHYQPVTDTSGDWNPFTMESIQKGLNSIASMLFSLTKTLAMLIDVSLGNLYSVNIIDSLSNKIDNISNSLWDNLLEHFGAVLFVIAVIQIFAYYVGQRNSSKAGTTALKLIAVIVLAFVWFSNSSYFLNTLNKLSNDMQGIVMSAGTFIADEQVEEGNELEGSQALMRNQTFELLVYKPYLQMNYGTTDEAVILENDEEGTHRINDLLSLKRNEDGLSERETIAQNEVEDMQNMSMSSSNVASKVGTATTSIFLAILLGIPLVIISMVNIILQIIALGISVILPISFIISFLPSFANSGFQTIGKLAGVFLMKVFVGLLILFTFLLIEITQTIIPTENMGLYILNVIVTGILLIFMLMKRDKIVEFITAGRVSTVDGGVSQASEKTKEKTKEATKTAARKTASTAGKTAVTAASMASGGTATAAQSAFKAGSHARNNLESRKNLRNQQRFADKQKELGNLVDMNEYKEQRKEENPQSPQPSANNPNRGNIKRTKQNSPDMNKTTGNSSANNESRENIQRTNQDSQITGSEPSQDKKGNQSKNVRVNNVQAFERNNRNNQSSFNKNNQSKPKNNRDKDPYNQLRQEPSKKDLNEQRKQSRTVQHNNPNNTPITQWEAKKQIKEQKQDAPQKQDVKKKSKKINRIRTKNGKGFRDRGKKRNKTN